VIEGSPSVLLSHVYDFNTATQGHARLFLKSLRSRAVVFLLGLFKHSPFQPYQKLQRPPVSLLILTHNRCVELCHASVLIALNLAP